MSLAVLTLLTLLHVAAPSSSTTVSEITDAGVDAKTAYLYMDGVIAARTSDIADRYPVASIRNRFRTFIRQVNTGKIVLVPERRFFRDEKADSETMTLAASKRIKGKPTIILSIPQWMLFHKRNQNYGLIDDLLAQIIMHELYHIEHHDLNGAKSQAETVRGERAAWIYTCRSVVDPQRAAKRYVGLALRDTASLKNCEALNTYGERSNQWNALFGIYRAP